jgi:hypothetical protein
VTVIACGALLAPEGHYMAHLHEPVAPSAAAERAAASIGSGLAWAKVTVDFPGPDGNPLNPRLGYEPAVLREIAATTPAAGWRRR